MSSFTFDECKNISFLLTPLSTETQGKRKTHYISKDAFCVMDVLEALSNSYSFYLPFHKEADEYHRIGRKTEDEFNLFTKTTEPILSGFESLVWNKERVNLGISVLIPGTVSINPVEADRVGLPRKIDSRIFRTYNLIKDGYLNQKRIVAAIPVKVYGDLQSKRKICEIIEEKSTLITELQKEYGGKYVIVKIHLYRIPVINQTYAEVTSGRDLFKICSRALELEALQKWVNGYYKNSKAKQPQHSLRPVSSKICLRISYGSVKLTVYAKTELTTL